LSVELIPLWLKIVYTLFLCVLVPIYWVHWGPKNFLWFSDIALLTTGVALWLESSLLASTMIVAIGLPELAWNVDFFARLISRRQVFGLSQYMFDETKPRFLRALSLFHVILPVLLVWMVYRLDYDRRAIVCQTLLAWIVLPVTYWLADPEGENINWVYGPGTRPQRWMPPLVYLALILVLFPLLLYLPVHLVMLTLFGPP
jgi:hypothetical protein